MSTCGCRSPRRVDEDHRFQRQLESQFAYRAKRKNDLGQTAFHVEHARTTNDIAVDRERSLCRRTDRPNRIVMTHQELCRPLPFAQAPARIDVPMCFLRMRCANTHIEVMQRIRQGRDDQLMRVWAGGWRLRIHHAFEQRDQLALLIPDVLEDPVGGIVGHCPATVSCEPGTGTHWNARSSRTGWAAGMPSAGRRE